MVIKKYIVKNMNEALTRIKYELGNDAVIIGKREVRESGPTGYFKPKLIEVTAALENNKLEKNEEEKTAEKNLNFEKNNSVDSFKASLNNIKNIIDKEEKKSSEQDESLENEIKEIKRLLNKIVKNLNKGNEEILIRDYLKDIDIDDDILENLDLDKYNNLDEFKEDFKNLLKKEIKIFNKDLKGKIALIGPTGGGKTTTIVKLAGKFALIDKKKVGLITTDTYRIGAVDQLKTYAEIMNIPFKAVITLKDLEEALKELENYDVILIDTTGRSSKDTMQISELRAFINKINPDSISLVISGTTKNKDIDTILNGFGEINYENIIITKLDETNSYGCIYNIIKKSEKEISYITTGQNVPEDIRIPTINEISQLIIGENVIQ